MRLVIRRHRPVRRVAIIAAGVLGCALFAWMMLDFGRWQYVLGLNDMLSERGADHELEQRSLDLAMQVDRVSRALQIEEQSRRELQDEIARLHGELAELQQEVEFYRKVIPADGDQNGPRIMGFRVTPQDAPGSYRYRIVLTHVGGDGKPVEGLIVMKIAGQLNGSARTLDLAGLSKAGAKVPEYRFKHFQRFEGEIQLPEGFAAEQVHLQLREKKQHKDLFQKSYNWVELFG